MADEVDQVLKDEVTEALNNEVEQIKDHGGRFTVERADPDDGVVELSLAGSCSTCVIAPMTIEAIENRLPALLDGVTTVHVKTASDGDGTMTVPSKTARMEEMDEYKWYDPPKNENQHF